MIFRRHRSARYSEGIPTPTHVSRGRHHWFVWLVVSGGQGCIFRLAMVAA